ncbi:hypothetical protein CHELA20_50316 [Hyphomicrobiales bacterium]|nr:hypothetical protein CHELA20_50316 [Hyphomicrobiales bacterium]
MLALSRADRASRRRAGCSRRPEGEERLRHQADCSEMDQPGAIYRHPALTPFLRYRAIIFSVMARLRFPVAWGR